MKRTTVILFFITAAVLTGIYFFYKKTYIKYELVYEIPGSKEQFAPNAYVFFHSGKELGNFIALNKDTKEIGEKIADVPFNFNKYSYCIFFGKKITSMAYSQKQIYFDDPTPSYARTKGSIPVFVEYEKDSSNNTGTFIYSVPKNGKLRGFYD